MTSDDEVQRQILRLHGLSLMNNILKEYPKDKEILTLVSFCKPLSLINAQPKTDRIRRGQDLTILTKWKFQTRNKIETSKIEDQIKLFTDFRDEKISTMAKEVKTFAIL
jgi:histone-lysine N-methyltransferase SETD2